MGISDDCLRSIFDRAELDAQLAGGDVRGDFDHFHKAIARFMFGDVPYSIVWAGLREEYTIWFSQPGLRINNEWVPAFYSTCLPYRT